MMMTALQIHCDGENCEVHYPEAGAADGAIFTPGDVRKMAKNHGWKRVGGRDLCIACEQKVQRAAEGLLAKYRQDAKR